MTGGRWFRDCRDGPFGPPLATGGGLTVQKLFGEWRGADDCGEVSPRRNILAEPFRRGLHESGLNCSRPRLYTAPRGPIAAYFLRFGACVNADPATRFTGAGVFGFLSSLAAVEATRDEVFSFAMVCTSFLRVDCTKPWVDD